MDIIIGLFCRIIGKTGLLYRSVRRRLVCYVYRSLFLECGKNVLFNPSDEFSYRTIKIGDDVAIGNGAKFHALKGIAIGNKVMIGPNCVIQGGNHNTSVLGAYMYDVKEKLPENDLPVVVEDDVWIGANVTILKGVVVHTGSIIAAGAVVTKDVPEYSVAAGVPARVIKMRWTLDEIKKHRELLKRSTGRKNRGVCL